MRFVRVSHGMVIFVWDIRWQCHSSGRHTPHMCIGHQFICTLHTYVKVASVELSFVLQRHATTTAAATTKSTNDTNMADQPLLCRIILEGFCKLMFAFYCRLAFILSFTLLPLAPSLSVVSPVLSISVELSFGGGELIKSQNETGHEWERTWIV